MHSSRRGCASCVQVGNELTLQARDLVLEHQLALLEAPQLQLIDVNVEREPRDHLIEVAMLDTQLPQLLEVAEQLSVDVVFDLRHNRDEVFGGRPERPP